MKTKVILFLILTFTVQSALTQTGSIVYTRNKDGKVQLSVPTSNNESPSVILNTDSNVIALGSAAQIIAQKGASSNKIESIQNVTLAKHPLWSQGEYVGSFTRISSGLYITAAHVLNKLSEQELAFYLSQLGLTEEASILQPQFQGRFLDIVLVSNLAKEEVQNKLNSMLGPVTAGDSFSLSHLTMLDSRLVEQKSNGFISVSQDNQTLYLTTGLESFLTWGSSGSVVLGKNESIRLIGIVQCVVKTKVASSQAPSERSYFRAFSSAVLISASLVPSSLSDLSLRTPDYGLEKCGPVSGKDGGG